jgi:hypothetical protein
MRDFENTDRVDFRARLLAASPAELSIKPSEHLPHVWAALLDWGLRGGSATIVAVADGTVSMYTSAGGGMIGAGQHQQIHMPAARRSSIRYPRRPRHRYRGRARPRSSRSRTTVCGAGWWS